MSRTRLPLLILFLTAITATTLAPPPTGEPDSDGGAEYQRLKAQAEAAVDEGSYAIALRLYEQAGQLDLPESEARWVAFRLGDCRWRSQAASRTADPSEYEAAKRQLESVIAAIERVPERDRAWAEANGSLGDYWWDRRDSRNWGQAWTHYQQALDWWAGSPEIDLARERYLRIVRTMAEPPGWGRRSWFQARVPVEILDNALRIAAPDDQPYFHYLLARTIQQQGGDWARRSRVIDHFESAIAAGPSDDWYDDALYRFGEWLMSQGRIVRMSRGQWRAEPDYVAAVKVFRRLLAEFRPGQSQYLDEARSRVEQITAPSLGLGVSNIFLPDSEIEYHVSWRNVELIELALYPSKLVRDVAMSGDDGRIGDWATQVDLAPLAPVRRWTIRTEDDGRHVPVSESRRLEKSLEPGAYVLQAVAGGTTARELVLVTDAAVVMKADEGKLVAFCADALTGAPLADAEVRVWTGRWRGGRWEIRDQMQRTGDDGVCVFEHELVDADRRNATHMIATDLGGRQAVARLDTWPVGSSQAPWRIYAFTDRPAYRPGESVQWKILARRYDNGEPFTPAGQAVDYQIVGPQGNAVSEGTATLNEFGSTWGELALDETMRLGAYNVTFRRKDGSSIGSAALFRLEEYKLPEFRVSLDTRDAKGRRRSHQVGDTVEVDVVAEYYFGGPVANATVEAVVHQKPFVHWWQPPREFAWCYAPPPRFNWWGPGQVVSRQTLRTDENGRATVVFETPQHAEQDFEYRIEARVTDASRREIVGADTVRVTRQHYYTYLEPERRLYEPRETVRVDVRTMDADSQPVSVTGELTVTRETWKEIWIAPDGREIGGEQLERLRRAQPVFPPPAPPGGPAWRMKFRGYEAEQILTRTLQTDDEGRGQLTFQPPVDGYYRVVWRSPDTLDPSGALAEEDWGDWITAETMVWVAEDRTRFIGYYQGGVDVVVDRDTIQAGRDAVVMISTPTTGRHVLFTVEGRRRASPTSTFRPRWSATRSSTETARRSWSRRWVSTWT
ncbi:MAG: MG2 domain-containing protein [Planctomycetota bacterium]|jgi:tetratricopeptide (TPR) repeat protein